MSLLITKDCVCCDACREECLDDAICENSPIYVIDPDLCSERVNDFPEPVCIVTCPYECIILDPDNSGTIEELRFKSRHREN